jgi:anti-sigma-K factor RskA
MNDDIHTLSGAYAIDALSPEEAEHFRTHLSQCQVCCDEVRELRAAASRMGANEALVPPAHLRARVLAAAAQQPQLPPVVRRPAGGSSSPRWNPRLLAAAAAVLLVVAAGIGIIKSRNDAEPVVAASVTRVFTAPDAHQATVRTANGGRLTVATSRQLNEMAVETDGLPQLGARQVYQIWAVHDGAMTPAAVLKDPTAGAAMALPGAGTEVAITIEPAGGSQRPTTKPIVTVDPSAV